MRAVDGAEIIVATPGWVLLGRAASLASGLRPPHQAPKSDRRGQLIRTVASLRQFRVAFAQHHTLTFR